MAKQIKTLLKIENKSEAAEVMDLLDELTTDEKKEMLIFLQGVKFAKGLDRGAVPAAVPIA
jgi:methionine salvage enolase-phosphatase E1